MQLDSTNTVDHDIDAGLAGRLNHCTNLPAPAGLLQRLLDLGDCEDATPADYARLISTSASLTAKLLETTNAPSLSGSSPVRKVIQAVNLLGTANVRIIALTHAAAAMHCPRTPEPMLIQYWRASLVKAALGRYLLSLLDRSLIEEGHLLGLLQDAPMAAMHAECPELYEDTIFIHDGATEKLLRLEAARFGVHHGQAAGVLARRLGASARLVELLVEHHQPLVDPGGRRLEPLELAARATGSLEHCCRSFPAGAVGRTLAVLCEHGYLAPQQHEHLKGVRQNYDKLCQGQTIAPIPVERRQQLHQRVALEVARTSTEMVLQMHGLISSAAQMDRELAAVNVEAVQLAEQTQEDPLTGALNRTGLEMIGGPHLDTLRQQGQSITVMFVDIDDFKRINDTLGHATGDEVIAHVADRLRRSLGSSALVGRYGGDEFVGLLGGLSAEQAEQLANELVANVDGGAPSLNGRATVSLSVGVVWRGKVPVGSVEALIDRADRLMYEAKAAGKNCIYKDIADE